MGALSAMIGAVCVGPGAAGMPLLETWGSAVHVLSHPSPEKTVDKEKQGHVLKGEHIEDLDRNVSFTDSAAKELSPHPHVGSNAHSYSQQCIQEGVRYLMRMLQVRNSVKLNDGVVLHDTTTAGFLSEGE